jgi:hypothetical protein
MEEKILLGLTVGQLRTMLAYVDEGEEVSDWIKSYEFQDAYTTYINDEWPDEEDFEEEDEELYEPDECYCDMEEYDEEDEDEDEEVVEAFENTPLSDPEQEQYALQVADDINRGAYSIDNVIGIINEEIIDRIRQLI